MKETYYFGSILNQKFCLLYIEKDKQLSFDQKIILPSDEAVFPILELLLEHFPEKPNAILFSETLTKIGLCRNTHISRKKNYLINRLDALLQEAFEAHPPVLTKFKTIHRKWLTYVRNKAPHFIEESICLKYAPRTSVDWAILHWHCLTMGQLNDAAHIEQKYLRSCGGLLHLIRQAYDLHLIGLLPARQVEQWTFRQIKSALSWLHSILTLSTSFTLSATTHILLEKLFLDLNHIIAGFLNKNPHLNYLKQNILAKHPEKPPSQTLLLVAENIINSQPSGTHQAIFSESGNQAVIQAKFSVNFLNKPCQEPNWDELFITPQEICEIERQAQEIWIITPHFLFDNNFVWMDFTEMYINNLSQSKKYVYFYPDEMAHQAQSMIAKLQFNHSDKMPEFIKVAELSSIFQFITSEIALYDPQDTGSTWHRGYYLDINDSLSLHRTLEDSFATIHQRIPDRIVQNIVTWCQERRYEAI